MDEAIKSGDLPNDAKIVAQILKSMGIDEVEGRVVPQLLEFMHRYVREVLEDAAIYAGHAGKAPALDLDDVRLAIQSRVNYSFTQPPPREFLIELAHTKNVIPLPFPPLRSLLRPSSSPSSSASSPFSAPPPMVSAVVLPPPQFRVKPLEWDWPQHSQSSTTATVVVVIVIFFFIVIKVCFLSNVNAAGRARVGIAIIVIVIIAIAILFSHHFLLSLSALSLSLCSALFVYFGQLIPLVV